MDADGAGSGTAVDTECVYDGQHILLAFDDNSDLSNRYLHGPIIDQILADEEVTSTSTEGDVHWPLTDHLGSVRDIVDSTGTVENHIIYDAYGNILSETDDTVDHIFGFTGRERDEESDLQFNRARFYDGLVGRWVSEDPAGFLAKSMNLAAYAFNNPTNFVDPSGLMGLPGRQDVTSAPEIEAPAPGSIPEISGDVGGVPGIGPPQDQYDWWDFTGGVVVEFGNGVGVTFSNGQAWDSFQGAVAGFVDFVGGVASFGSLPSLGDLIPPLYGHDDDYNNGRPVGSWTGIAILTVAGFAGGAAGAAANGLDNVGAVGDIFVGVANGNLGQAAGGLANFIGIPGGRPKGRPGPRPRPDSCFVAGTKVVVLDESTPAGAADSIVNWLLQPKMSWLLCVVAVGGWTTLRSFERRRAKLTALDRVFATHIRWAY